MNTILIVEDEYANFRYLYELLESKSNKILHASNGLEAISSCRNNSSINLILMDIRMPIMDGTTASKLIKAIRPELPIIAQTAYIQNDEMESFITICDDYITKPINKEELRKKISKYLNIG